MNESGFKITKLEPQGYTNSLNIKPRLRTVANALTLFRLFAGIPVVLALGSEFLSLAWICIFICGATDIADGYLARKAGGGSAWGARFDPLADKILLLAPLIWLASNSVLPLWSIWLLISRELLITAWRSSAAQGGEASLQGKLKTILQFTSILLMIWPISWGGLYFSLDIQRLGWLLFWPSLILATNSGIRYFNPQAKSDQN